MRGHTRVQPGESEGASRSQPSSFAQELLVEEKDEKVDVDLGFIEELHDGHTLVLELEQVLGQRTGVSILTR